MIFHPQNGFQIAEMPADMTVIHNIQDALDLLMEAKMGGAHKMIWHQNSMTPDFFDLKTGLAGEILQKYINYGMQLAIVGNFSQFESESLRAFMVESNRGKQLFFVETLERALVMLAV